MDADRKKLLLERIESGYSLPALSVVAIRLVELASDDTCSVIDLTSLIEKDPSGEVIHIKHTETRKGGSNGERTITPQDACCPLIDQRAGAPHQ